MTLFALGMEAISCYCDINYEIASSVPPRPATAETDKAESPTQKVKNQDRILAFNKILFLLSGECPKNK
jgi:hypothetical protein